jgi:hypothetical protein
LSCVISLARSCKRSGQAHSHQAGGWTCIVVDQGGPHLQA